jgi:type VI secretion system protein ImpF
MAQLTPKERLQPSLLDRLAAPRPETRGLTMMVSVEQLRESVRRELTALFSAVSLEIVEKSVEGHKEVRRSGLNFGMPALSGRTVSSVNIAMLERQLTRAIRDFEPRLAGNSLRVRALGEDNEKGHNRLAFEIEGELWAQPLPQKLLLRTELDLESGQVLVEESRG